MKDERSPEHDAAGSRGPGRSRRAVVAEQHEGSTVGVVNALPALFDLELPAPDPVIARQPVGPLIDTADGEWGRATATFNTDRTHRFRLSRVWEPTGRRVNFLMLNPSTADAFVLDRTVHRCVGFAQTWGMGALEVTNVFAMRSTDPAGLKRVDDPVGAGNDDAIVAAALAADVVVVAWGVHATLGGRNQHIAALLHDAGVRPVALRVTKSGHPGHPLYVPGSAHPVPWRCPQPS